MALSELLLAPTTAASINAVEVVVPAGSTATVALYTATGGALPLIPNTTITHKNPAGTYQDTNYILGNGSSPESYMPQFLLGPGVWSFIKPPSAIAYGIMIDS